MCTSNLQLHTFYCSESVCQPAFVVQLELNGMDFAVAILSQVVWENRRSSHSRSLTENWNWCKLLRGGGKLYLHIS